MTGFEWVTLPERLGESLIRRHCWMAPLILACCGFGYSFNGHTSGRARITWMPPSPPYLPSPAHTVCLQHHLTIWIYRRCWVTGDDLFWVHIVSAHRLTVFFAPFPSLQHHFMLALWL